MIEYLQIKYLFSSCDSRRSQTLIISGMKIKADKYTTIIDITD